MLLGRSAVSRTASSAAAQSRERAWAREARASWVQVWVSSGIGDLLTVTPSLVPV